MSPGPVATAVANPWFSWTYLERNGQDVLRHLEQHAALTAQAVLLALAVALPLAALAHVRPRLAGVVLAGTGVLYTVPSLALFAVLAPYTGIGRRTVLIGLVVYALLVLVRNVLVGLQGVDPAVRDAARGMGYGRVRMLLAVELPQAVPAVVTGLRLATVSTVALVTVGVVVGYGGLGQLMFRGFRSNYRAEVVTATVLCLLLALVADLLLATLGRLLTPWHRSSRRGRGASPDASGPTAPGPAAAAAPARRVPGEEAAWTS
ncbi:ABC transporter permease subunit [Cellulomonas shaoxiangyii]|uniref:ABC transporter permease subunit n=1 Tax=Cellulomonas shaoxiangyii TaxID=2566013 RepID=A0A4P7SJS1_9CELL|nr:ABC transporter permease subunit [Cellulomonas shaoxiangyii]QCB94081.1 ABC transporter permease subunit [Cellulomonas shaoxiangyii]TGY83757.1 ABC transporter permease subunit [Cellulomonas shaoxiangyii]